MKHIPLALLSGFILHLIVKSYISSLNTSDALVSLGLCLVFGIIKICEYKENSQYISDMNSLEMIQKEAEVSLDRTSKEYEVKMKELEQREDKTDPKIKELMVKNEIEKLELSSYQTQQEYQRKVVQKDLGPKDGFIF